MKINPELTCFFPVLGSESGFVMKAGKGFKKKKTVMVCVKQDNGKDKNYY